MSPQQGYYEDDIEIICAIVFEICMNHAFNDRNKMSSKNIYWEKINKKIDIDNDKYEQLIWKLADWKLSKEQFNEIIKKSII